MSPPDIDMEQYYRLHNGDIFLTDCWDRENAEEWVVCGTRTLRNGHTYASWAYADQFKEPIDPEDLPDVVTRR